MMEVLSEDWNEDFVFEARPDDDDNDDDNDGVELGDAFDDGDRRGDRQQQQQHHHHRPGTGAVRSPERGRYVIVPQAIKERQANVHGDLGQVKDFAGLVEELKRLRLVAQARGIVDGPSAELWQEADDIIDLASSNHDDDRASTNGSHAAHPSASACPPPSSHAPSSPGWGWGFDPFEEEAGPVMAVAAAAASGPSRKRRKSVLSLDEEFYSSPATTAASNGPLQQARDRPPDEGSGGISSSSTSSNGSNISNGPASTLTSSNGSSNGSSDGLYSNGSSTTTTTTTTHQKASPSLSRMPSRSSRPDGSPSVARTVIETIHQRRAAAVSPLAEHGSPSTAVAPPPPPPPPKKMPFDSTTLRELVAHVRLLSRRLAELVRGAERESPRASRSQSPHLSPTPSFGQVLAGSVTSSPSFGCARPAKKSKSATDVLAPPPPPPSTMTTGKENEMEMGGGPILMAVI